MCIKMTSLHICSLYKLTPGSEVVQDIPEAVYSTTGELFTLSPKGGAQGG